MNVSPNSSIEEAIKIISINKSKANSLRMSLLQNIINNNEFILKIRQYLGEFEYDLNTLYNIIKDLKILIFNNNQNNYNNSINTEEEKNNFNYSTKLNNGIKNIKKKNISLKLLKRHKNHFSLNNLQDYFDGLGENNKKDNKTYNLTINICDGRHFDSSQKRDKKIYKSNSCKSFLRKNNFDFFNNYKSKNSRNLKRDNDFNYRNYLNKNNNLENQFYSEDNKNNNLSKNKSPNDNYNHYTYVTDYSTYKTTDNSNFYNKHNLINSNINKNKISLKNLSNIYDHYNSLLNNSKREYNNYNKNQNQNKNENLENHINYILSSNNEHNFSNSTYNFIPRLDLENIEDNNNCINNGRQSLINNYYEIRCTNSESNKNNINNYYNEESIDINNRRNNQNNNLNENHNNRITYALNYDINEHRKNLENNNLKRYEKMSNLNGNNNFNQNEYMLDENKKNEMLENIISLILQDTNKLNHRQKYFGDDIGEKLLKRDINQETLFKIVEILKNYQNNLKSNRNEKNLFRGSRKNYSNNRFNRKYNDNIILKETLNNNGHINKEYPLGLLSMNDYFN